MVAGFRRSLSLIGSNSSPNSPRHNKGRAPEKSFHVRSASLPCRSHPTIAQLEDEIRALRKWQSQSEVKSNSSTWLSAGMAQLELLHDSIHDLLLLPQVQDSLRHGSGWSERSLEDFLRLADAHGSFRSALMDMKEHQYVAQVAFRRRDEAQFASCLRSNKRIEKELFKLSSEVREISKSLAMQWSFSNAREAEIARIMREVTSVTASTSAFIFLSIAAASATTSAVASCSSSSKSTWMVSPLRKLSSLKNRGMEDIMEAAWRQSALDKLEGLEECIEALEARNERVFKSLLNTRVALLNILTPSI